MIKNRLRAFLPSSTLTLLLITSPAVAQVADTPDLKGPMSKLSFLIGAWEGVSSVNYGPGQESRATGTEVVEWKQDGRLLLINGNFSADQGTSGSLTVHNALGIIFYDPERQTYVIDAYRDGRHVRSDLELLDGGTGFRWGFKETRSGVETRFTMTLSDEGEWVERGEVYYGGQWRPFLEMRLKKIPDTND